MDERTHVITDNGELKHYGVKGMKWGVRRYQNPDGSLTPKGKKRMERLDKSWVKKVASTKNRNRITSMAYDRFNSGLSELNKTMKNREKADRTYTKFMNDMLHTSVKDLLKEDRVSPSGRYEFEMFINTIGDFPMAVLVDNEKR